MTTQSRDVRDVDAFLMHEAGYSWRGIATKLGFGSALEALEAVRRVRRMRREEPTFTGEDAVSVAKRWAEKHKLALEDNELRVVLDEKGNRVDTDEPFVTETECRWEARKKIAARERMTTFQAVTEFHDEVCGECESEEERQDCDVWCGALAVAAVAQDNAVRVLTREVAPWVSCEKEDGATYEHLRNLVGKSEADAVVNEFCSAPAPPPGCNQKSQASFGGFNHAPRTPEHLATVVMGRAKPSEPQLGVSFDPQNFGTLRDALGGYESASGEVLESAAELIVALRGKLVKIYQVLDDATGERNDVAGR